MLDKKVKQRIINKYRTHENDTGSSQVQIALLSEEIKQLSDHLIMHKHDHSSRRGLLRKVNERRKLLKYLQKKTLIDFTWLGIMFALNFLFVTTLVSKSGVGIRFGGFTLILMAKYVCVLWAAFHIQISKKRLRASLISPEVSWHHFPIFANTDKS